MLSLAEIDNYERRLHAAVLALNSRKVAGLTLIEAIDQAALWPNSFEQQQPLVIRQTVTSLLDRAPLFMCAIASEIGFRFEGVGTEFWNKLIEALGLPITMADRIHYSEAFKSLAAKFDISQPSRSAFSSHFSIISWPIANALVPLDLLGAVSRLLARAPLAALPGSGRTSNFASLRAWASAVEGARLVDWLRLEAASERVLLALLNENRGGPIPAASYSRLQDAVARSSETFQTTRKARQRARRSKTPASAETSFGYLTLSRQTAGLKLYATWPQLPGDLVDEAKAIARAAGWRPQLWGSGAHLHSDTALSDGPFALSHVETPNRDLPAYSDLVAVFGEGSTIAAALAGRSIDWTETMLFDVNSDRTRGDQRFTPFDVMDGPAWLASRSEHAGIDRLRSLGNVGGYRVFEADLGSEVDRLTLIRGGFFAARDRTLVARHPVDAITASQGVVRPGRRFATYQLGPPIALQVIQGLKTGDHTSYATGVSGHPRLSCEARIDSEPSPLTLSILERDTAFSALLEQRLLMRVESSHSLRNVPITAELEINDRLLVRCTAVVAEVPVTLDQHSSLLQPLYNDRVRARLLESGNGRLRFSIGPFTSIEVPLTRPLGAVNWSTQPPELFGAKANTELVFAPATLPYSFTPASHIATPERGAVSYALRFSDGRMADPLNLLASPTFNLGDFAANFSLALGSRQFRNSGRGAGEVARARIAWSRAQCTTLQAIAAKSRVVRQFEGALIFNLCGREWFDHEQDDRSARSDPHETLYHVALEQGLASLPNGVQDQYAIEFAEAFALHARQLDPDWPLNRPFPLDGTMDDALNLGFASAVGTLQMRGALTGIDPDDCDFGSPQEAWIAAANEALRRIRRSRLARLIAPSEGGRQLQNRFYNNVGIAEMAEDLAAWTRTFALPRGQLNAETAASALQLWVSPAACVSLDAAMRVLINDPFVSRATRYMAIRMQTTLLSAVS